MKKVEAKNSSLKIHFVPISELTLAPSTKKFFEQDKAVFAKHPVFLKGGAARGPFLAWALRKLHGMDVQVKNPLDWDLLYIADEKKGEFIRRTDIQRMFKTRVFLRDIERLPNREQYFGSRDYGVNEVLLNPTGLWYSEKAFRDAKKMAVRASGKSHMKERIQKETPGGDVKLALRAISFAIEHGLNIKDELRAPAKNAYGKWLLQYLLKSFEKGFEDKFWKVLLDAGNPSAKESGSPEQMLLTERERNRYVELFPQHWKILEEAQRKVYEQQSAKKQADVQQDLDSLATLMSSLLRELARVFDTPHQQLTDADAKEIARLAKRLSANTLLRLEGPSVSSFVKKSPVGKNYKMGRMAVSKMAKATTADALNKVIRWISPLPSIAIGELNTTFREMLMMISALGHDVGQTFELSPWKVILIDTHGQKWTKPDTETIREALNKAAAILKQHGLEKLAKVTVRAFNSKNIPYTDLVGDSAAAHYAPAVDKVSVAFKRPVDDLVKSIIHELGHRYFFKLMDAGARHRWQKFFEASQGDVPNIASVLKKWRKKAEHEWNVNQNAASAMIDFYITERLKTDPQEAMWLLSVKTVFKIEDPADWDALRAGHLPGLNQVEALHKQGKLKIFQHPVTPYSTTNSFELFAEVFAFYLTLGPQALAGPVQNLFRSSIREIRNAAAMLDGLQAFIEKWKKPEDENAKDSKTKKVK